MPSFDYALIPETDRKPRLGLIVLQSDETVEAEIHQLLPPTQFDVLVSRVPSGETVNEESLAAMAGHIQRSAELFPKSAAFEAVAYCCTSGTSVIGAQRVAELVGSGCKTKSVTNPLSALIAACEKRQIKKLAFLSPYVEAVSSRLRNVLAREGIDSPVFGSFDEAEEAKVAWIDSESIRRAAHDLAQTGDAEGIFLSCTNLKTVGLIETLQTELGMPVLSSNFVLAEKLRHAATQVAAPL